LPGGDESYWDIEKKIRYHEGLLGATMGLTGSGSALRREFWQKIPDNCLADDLAIALSVLNQGKKVCFDPEVKIIEALAAELEIEFPRKIRTLSANWQIFFSVFSYALPKSIGHLFLLFSHKFLRLLLPFVCLGMVVSGLLMRCQVLNYLFLTFSVLALLSLKLKILSPLRQFLYLNLAAVVAFFVWSGHSKKGFWSVT
jgi:biofilm PGA synthesis N-glycosyltransferase PgaC